MKRLASISLVSILFGLSCKTVQTQASDPKFGAGEHQALGDDGYRLACESMAAQNPQFICLEKIDRADRSDSFTYGELVALSGDFYSNWQNVDADKARRRVIFDSWYNDINKFREATKAEYAAMEAQQTSNVNLPDKNMDFTEAFGIEFATLATDNIDHFGWHNMKRYVKEHSEALQVAIEGYRAPKEKKAEYLRKALLINSFADHFLTDGFASGHVRVPRAQGIRWSAGKAYSAQAIPQVNGALAKILHDNDHKYSGETKGLKVINSKGVAWETRADGQLYLFSNADSVFRTIPVKSVSLSVSEILEAFYLGKLPEKTFLATELVPFIDPNEESLESTFDTKKLGKDGRPSVKELAASAAILRVAIPESLVITFFDTIPLFMKQFRADIAADLNADQVDHEIEVRFDDKNGPRSEKILTTKYLSGKVLQQRLPKAYIEGYKKVQ